MEGDTNNKPAPSKKNRIGNSEIILLVVFALIFDIISLIPFLNFVTVIVAQGLMAFFFSIHGVNVLSKKRAIPYVLGWIIEFIPAISVIPAITLETIIIIVMVRFEDKTGISVGKDGIKPAAK
jgi:hypothetical protein